MKPVTLFTPTFRIDETLAGIRECLEKGWTGVGFKTLEFEKAWCDYSGLPYAHFLSSATAGLHLGIRLLKTRRGWSDGDEVITTPLTFVSTNHAILYERLRPVFADVDQYLCLDPDSIEARITPRTRAVMFVGLGGNPGQLRRIAELCREHRISLILDAAHMAGTRWADGKHVGHEADATIFSFHAVKNLPTADGGMICLPDAEMDAAARKLSWMGINKDTFARTGPSGSYKWKYDVEEVGFKYHGNSVMAAIALVALKYVDSDNEWRRRLAAWYDEGLQATSVETVPMAPGCTPARHLYQIMSDRRDDLMAALANAGIATGVHYETNTSYRMYSYAAGTCPNAERASSRLVSLPMSLAVTQEDVERICSVIAGFR